MKKFLINYGWTMWVGFWLGALDIPFWDWRWWVFFVPLALMISIKDHYKEKENNDR